MNRDSGLQSDFYELTMMQGYYLHQYNPPADFEMFFRAHPFGGGYTIAAGLELLLGKLERIHFDREEIDYLKSTGLFQDSFLDYLSGLSFTGNVYAVEEGALVFPGEPLVRIHAPLIEAQWVESLVLNIINFQSLIATKTSRICSAAREKAVVDFGFRRAQGLDGAFSATRAAYIGGVSGTSNTLAGKEFAIPVKGTMAHSWIMAFGDEEEAFYKYSQTYPDSSVLLIDTFDTLENGLPNAIHAGKRLLRHGHTAFGVRLDSGDLEQLSFKVREKLDAAGLEGAVIIASNDLDEYEIQRLRTRNAPIDVFGVGTRLITAYDDPALGGVYKLTAVERSGVTEYRMKVSEDPEKITLPGVKQVYRISGQDGIRLSDLMTLDGEEVDPPSGAVNSCPLLSRYMKEGRVCKEMPELSAVREKRKKEFARFPGRFTRLADPEIYPVFISEGLLALKNNLSP